MSGEQQLERSILERKERDELQTIAAALSIKVGSRARKADIVDQILEAGGVDMAPGTAGAKGTRSRAAGNGAAKAAGNGEAPGSRRTRSTGVGGNGSTDGVEDDAPRSARSHGGPSGGDSGDEDGSVGGAGVSTSDVGARRTGVSGEADIDALATAGLELPSESGGSASAGSSGDSSTGWQQRPGRGPSGGAQGGRYAGGGGYGQGAQGAEPGNKRSRRRRGRERGPGGRETGPRDLQGGSHQDANYSGELVGVEGYLDLRDEGYGFLRTRGFLPSQDDVYVSVSQVRRFGLRKGDLVQGACRPAASNEKYPALLRVDTVTGLTPDEAQRRPRFEDLTPLFPDEKLRLEMPGDQGNMTARIVDLLSPIGKGQRGLIVSPPKAGKTTILKQISHSIEANNPDVHLMVLLVDERPEEVTDMRRHVTRGEVVASTFDRPTEEHTQVAELAIEKARRLVELGTDVVIILDGITRLARAYNLAQPASGRIMSGGVDSGALYPPKKFFGAARNIEEGGSLTILATALVETGSKMDEVIFEEFKGTGNMELRLDRKLAERRIYPAIDVNASSTRHEELLFDRSQLQQVWKLRRVLNALAQDGSNAPGLELLMDKIKTTATNDEFLAEIAKGPAPTV